jgi:hypothetical protein
LLMSRKSKLEMRTAVQSIKDWQNRPAGISNYSLFM